MLLAGFRLLAAAIEPAEKHVGVWAGGDELDLAAGLQRLSQIQRPDAVGIIGVVAAPPESAADLAGRSPGMGCLAAESEIVRPTCSRSSNVA